MVIREMTLIDAPDQEFTTVIGGQRCSFRFRYNTFNDRWSFDLKIGDLLVLTGRRVLLNVDLFRAFKLGIGQLFAIDIDGGDNDPPDRQNIPARRVRLYLVEAE